MMGARSKTEQIALPLGWSHGREGQFVLTPELERLLAPLADGGLWAATGAVLAGPGRSGKSAIARWVEHNTDAVVVDDADHMAEDTLFHEWNRAREAGSACLMVAEAPPGDWGLVLPDLKSRIASALLIELPPPDETLMRALIEQHLARQGAVIPPDAMDYALRRIERSHAAAEQFALAANGRSLSEKKPITQPLVRALIEDMDTEGAPGLFDAP